MKISLIVLFVISVIVSGCSSTLDAKVETVKAEIAVEKAPEVIETESVLFKTELKAELEAESVELKTKLAIREKEINEIIGTLKIEAKKASEH